MNKYRCQTRSKESTKFAKKIDMIDQIQFLFQFTSIPDENEKHHELKGGFIREALQVKTLQPQSRRLKKSFFKYRKEVQDETWAIVIEGCEL